METEERIVEWKVWLINAAVTGRSYMGSWRRIAARSSGVEKTMLTAEAMMTHVFMIGIGVGGSILILVQEGFER